MWRRSKYPNWRIYGNCLGVINRSLLYVYIYTNKTIIVYRCYNDNKAETHNKYNVRLYKPFLVDLCECGTYVLITFNTSYFLLNKWHHAKSNWLIHDRGREKKLYLLWKHLNNNGKKSNTNILIVWVSFH